jgi:L-tartrate/succinate antiporter
MSVQASKVHHTPAVASHWVWRAPWRAILPVALTVAIAATPVPAGLPPHAWYYFAIFAGVIGALVLEPLPSPAIGLIGVVTVTVLAPWVLFAPDEMSKPTFKLAEESLKWALTGFSSSTVWLVFGAFMFALGYETTGLGRRIALRMVKAMGRHTLALGYATTLTDAILAPATPSNTARSAGTIFPVMANLPPLYGSMPNEPSARKIGGYIMWVSFAAGCVTSSLFMTACAPNFLALEFIRKIAKVDITYAQWMQASIPFALPLLLLLPILTWIFYPPQTKGGPEVPAWAGQQLQNMGPLSSRERILSALVILAIALWVFGSHYIEAATTALLVISLMLIFRVVTWKEMAGNHAAWTTLTLLATLVTLAGGLSRTGFIKWFADNVAAHMGGLSPTLTVMALVTVYFLSHYMFASLTAHTTAMLPVMLAVGLGIPGVPADKMALALALTTGIMGVITPYATGPGLAYYESGYLPSGDFWRLATIFGFIFLAALLFIGVPLLLI